MNYKEWESVEFVQNSDDDFACKHCGERFALIALFAYPGSDGLRKAFPYWCPRCDAPPRGTKK